MEKYDELERHILTMAEQVAPSRSFQRVPSLSAQFGVHDGDVEEILTRMHEDRLIDVASWDGKKERSLDDWPEPSQAYRSLNDANNVRIRILVEGQRRLAAARGHATKPRQIFISHIVQEKPVALKLQEYLRKALGDDVPIFVS